jgi:hypothetical protein
MLECRAVFSDECLLVAERETAVRGRVSRLPSVVSSALGR